MGAAAVPARSSTETRSADGDSNNGIWRQPKPRLELRASQSAAIDIDLETLRHGAPAANPYESAKVTEGYQLHKRSILRLAMSIASGLLAFTSSSLAASQRAAAASASCCTARTAG